jgi:hypothetical protein
MWIQRKLQWMVCCTAGCLAATWSSGLASAAQPSEPQQQRQQTAPSTPPPPPSPPPATAAPIADTPTILDDAPYFEVTPAAVDIPFAGDFDNQIDVSYQWGVGLGYFLRPREHFMLGLGGVFEHTVLNVERSAELFGGLGRDLDAHGFRIGPELRLGVGGDRMWAYIGAVPGLALHYVVADDNDEDNANAGFVAGARFGVQGLVWRRLYVGVEAFTNSSFFEGPGQGDDYELHSAGARVYMGWFFRGPGDWRTRAR